ncbi:hypothetical protein KIH74_22895 [Kineosporia sp. J2-2]|uniref:Terminase small subunit n=1 Tax=Kineosporia corallincola TaxID=2835133 RepID=A0ABS5TL30_9ACTN|nr:hypothetical protein [Kineosporia corallincola]MBT0771807.1 hypothetical protein [Kineosporia corallincola]
MDRLPPESHFKTDARDAMDPAVYREALGPAESWGRWSSSDHLAAAQVDALRRIEWLLATVNSEKGKAPKHPDPVPRPGVSGGLLGSGLVTSGSESLQVIAELKARQRAMGAEPKPDQVQAVLDEMMGGGSDE